MKTILAAAAAALLSLTLAQSVGAAEGKFLADRHAAAGVKRESCHGAKASEPPSKEQCLACHGGSYEKLADATEGKADQNYHRTHLGEPNCDQCHQGHKPPRLACDQCHEFQVNVP